MARLSVNINKIATLRNARGKNNPNIIQMAQDCERFGAQGITVHPRPDERHITRNDVYELKKVVKTEFNIEGYPDERYLEIVKDIKPTQATLVPDPPDVLTSNAGWDIAKHFDFLKETLNTLKGWGIRTSIFLEPDKEQVQKSVEVGTDRIELYTEYYAENYSKNKQEAVVNYAIAASEAEKLNIGVNAGHDLNLENLSFFKENIPNLLEVSIGHALICDALYLGLENTIQLYLRQLK